MLLTFLNLVVIGGLLQGIVEGSFKSLREYAIGDLLISNKEGVNGIKETQRVVNLLRENSSVKGISPRYYEQAIVTSEKDFFNVTNINEPRSFQSVNILGIFPEEEEFVTKLSTKIKAGSYFSSSYESNSILIGQALVKKYSPFGELALDVDVGDYVYMRIGNATDFQKFYIKGILRAKSQNIDNFIIMPQRTLRYYAKNDIESASQIAVRLADKSLDEKVKSDLLLQGAGKYAKVQTLNEAVGSFLDQIRTTFVLIGLVVGGIGLIVASITIFIIIYVTASSRQVYIGILKGIGITEHTIRLSYIWYALFYALIGCVVGLLILQFVLRPYFLANPLDFPFSDGILYAPWDSVFTRVGVILFVTFWAGLIPASLILRKPAIDAIMGR
ncbi:MAG: ABC transporter permease [Alphaproteobacteria bacterium]|nr:ABC transporter permease [Alphaproteobacteria bacterium]